LFQGCTLSFGCAAAKRTGSLGIPSFTTCTVASAAAAAATTAKKRVRVRHKFDVAHLVLTFRLQSLPKLPLFLLPNSTPSGKYSSIPDKSADGWASGGDHYDESQVTNAHGR
jgi:hypothetical protein